MTCAIVIPCFRESTRLPPFLGALAAQLSGFAPACKITVVDDGSGPEESRKTMEAIAPIMAAHPQLFEQPLLLPKNQGKGHAVHTAWRQSAAQGADLLAFVDADGSTNAIELCNLIRHLSENYQRVDAVFGSRVKLLGKIIVRNLHRHLIGRCFTTMSSVITGLEAYDSQCGAKVLKTEAYLTVAPLLMEQGFVFDVELTVALLQKGFRIVEVPISWTDVPGSKVHLVRDIVRMALGLFRIRRTLGRYSGP